MPRLVDMGGQYGTMEFPDNATDEDVAATADRLEEQRQRDIVDARSRLQEATAEVERQTPSFGKTLAQIGINLPAGIVGGTKQIVGNVARSAADLFSTEDRNYMRNNPAPAGMEYQIDPLHWTSLLREAGKDVEAQGSERIKQANIESEKLGGGTNDVFLKTDGVF